MGTLLAVLQLHPIFNSVGENDSEGAVYFKKSIMQGHIQRDSPLLGQMRDLRLKMSRIFFLLKNKCDIYFLIGILLYCRFSPSTHKLSQPQVHTAT